MRITNKLTKGLVALGILSSLGVGEYEASASITPMSTDVKNAKKYVYDGSDKYTPLSKYECEVTISLKQENNKGNVGGSKYGKVKGLNKTNDKVCGAITNPYLRANWSKMNDALDTKLVKHNLKGGGTAYVVEAMYGGISAEVLGNGSVETQIVDATLAGKYKFANDYFEDGSLRAKNVKYFAQTKRANAIVSMRTMITDGHLQKNGKDARTGRQLLPTSDYNSIKKGYHTKKYPTPEVEVENYKGTADDQIIIKNAKAGNVYAVQGILKNGSVFEVTLLKVEKDGDAFVEMGSGFGEFKKLRVMQTILNEDENKQPYRNYKASDAKYKNIPKEKSLQEVFSIPSQGVTTGTKKKYNVSLARALREVKGPRWEGYTEEEAKEYVYKRIRYALYDSNDRAPYKPKFDSNYTVRLDFEPDLNTSGYIKILSKKYGFMLTANGVDINDKLLGLEETFSEESLAKLSKVFKDVGYTSKTYNEARLDKGEKVKMSYKMYRKDLDISMQNPVEIEFDSRNFSGLVHKYILEKY